MDNIYNQNFQNNQSFIGFVQNGKIFNSYGSQIGYTNDEYNKAIETAKGFQQKLIEAGILTKPKTPEEINQESRNIKADSNNDVGDVEYYCFVK